MDEPLLGSRPLKMRSILPAGHGQAGASERDQSLDASPTRRTVPLFDAQVPPRAPAPGSNAPQARGRRGAWRDPQVRIDARRQMHHSALLQGPAQRQQQLPFLNARPDLRRRSPLPQRDLRRPPVSARQPRDQFKPNRYQCTVPHPHARRRGGTGSDARFLSPCHRRHASSAHSVRTA